MTQFIRDTNNEIFRDICEGEELLYDYGIKSLPWMQKVRMLKFFIFQF